MKIKYIGDEEEVALVDEGGITAINFDNANEAMQFAERNHIDVVENEIVIGYKLGGFAVGLTEGSLSGGQIVRAITETTDACWRENLLTLATLITEAANELR